MLPSGKRPVGCKYVFKLKLLPSSEIERHRVRLVAQRFLQQKGVDYNEVFAPVVDNTSISLLLAIADQNDWEIEGMDVVSSFLHGKLEEKVYMTNPPGMKIPGGKIGRAHTHTHKIV